MEGEATCRNAVLFSARFLPNMGGVEFFTANLARRLASTGHDVLVVTTEPGDDPAMDARQMVGEGTYEVVRLGSWGPARMPFVRKDRRYRELVARLEGIGRFGALINTRFYSLSRVAATLCGRLGVRPVLIDHGTGYVMFSNPALTLASKALEHTSTAYLSHHRVDYYGVSKDASRWLAHFGITSCGEIHNALDADAFVSQASGRDFRREAGVAEGVICVTFASRLLPEKGADTIVEAARLLAGDDRLHFFIAGTGPMEKEIEASAGELPNLSYVGMLDHSDLASLLLTSDAFCFPTRYSEGLPTSLLEAGACGCALVASHAGGVDEIISTDEQGVILNNPSTSAVVEALRELASDPDMLATLKRGARERICERFTWDSSAQELLRAFSNAAR